MLRAAFRYKQVAVNNAGAQPPRRTTHLRPLPTMHLSWSEFVCVRARLCLCVYTVQYVIEYCKHELQKN